MHIKGQRGIILLNIVIVSVVVLGALLFVVGLSTHTQHQIDLSLIEKRAEYALIAAVNIGQQKLIQHPTKCPSDFTFGPNAGSLVNFEVSYQCESGSIQKLAQVRVKKGEQFAPDYVSKTYQFS